MKMLKTYKGIKLTRKEAEVIDLLRKPAEGWKLKSRDGACYFCKEFADGGEWSVLAIEQDLIDSLIRIDAIRFDDKMSRYFLKQ